MHFQYTIPLSSFKDQASHGLKKEFDREADVIAAAPGRINLIGEHIDYCDGFVLPFAIDRYVVIAAALNGTSQARIATSLGGEPSFIALDEPQKISEPKWSNYLRGVIHGFQSLGLSIPGFDAYIISSVPSGAGLSSSAALECCMATLLEHFTKNPLSKKQKAFISQKAEHDFVGVPCGIMDQFASIFGSADHLVLIDCQSAEPQLIPFDQPDLTMLVANTNVSHELSDGGYAARRKHTEEGLFIMGKNSWRDVSLSDVESHWDTLGNPINRRARHVVSEISRTISAASALKKNDFEALGSLMYESHKSLKDDFEVSCEELDLMVELAASIGRSGGVIGSRMTGGGFGGSTITLCESHKAEEIAKSLYDRYVEKTGIIPQIFASRPSKGAHLVSEDFS